MWLALEARFAPKGISAQISSYTALSKTLKTQEEKWIDYFKRQDDLATRFLGLFPGTFTISNLKDLILMVTTVQQLPSENPTRLMLETNPALSNNVVHAAIKQYIATHEGEEPPTETASRAFVPSNKSVNCFLCNNPHYLSTCKFFPYYAELFEKEKRERTGYFALSPAQQQTYQNKAQGSNSNHSYSSGYPRRSRGGRGGKANAASTEAPVDAPPMESAGSASLSSPHSPTTANHWIADTGASISMTFRREWLHGMKVDRRPIKLADGNVIFSAGIGQVSFIPHSSSGDGAAFTILNVLYVPDLRTNLLSVFSLTRTQGFRATIDTKSIIFWKGELQIFRGILTSTNTAYLDVTTEAFDSAATAFAAVTGAAVSIDLWHKRFVHRSMDMLEKLRRSDAVKGFRVTAEKSSGNKCVSCIEGKLTRAPHSKPATMATRPLERVFTDVHGPILRSREGFEYWLTFIDQFSGFAAIYCLRKKSDTFATFKTYKAWAENAIGQKMGTLRHQETGKSRLDSN